MTNVFLAEDFRKLMDALNNVNDDEEQLKPSTNIEDLMRVERPEDLSKDEISDVKGLIRYLDQFSELDRWRDGGANYDDAFYKGLPLDQLYAIAGIDRDELEKISSRFKEDSENVLLKDGYLSIHGET